MTDNEKVTLWVGANRYYLGRMTASVSEHCLMLIKNWPDFPTKLQYILQRDIEQAFERDDQLRLEGKKDHLPLGMDCDRAEWEKVRKIFLVFT